MIFPTLWLTCSHLGQMFPEVAVSLLMLELVSTFDSLMEMVLNVDHLITLIIWIIPDVFTIINISFQCFRKDCHLSSAHPNHSTREHYNITSITWEPSVHSAWAIRPTVERLLRMIKIFMLIVAGTIMTTILTNITSKLTQISNVINNITGIEHSIVYTIVRIHTFYDYSTMFFLYIYIHMYIYIYVYIYINMYLYIYIQ